MRIVAGELGGRRLWAPRGRRLRPTADRVREAIFSILGDVAGAAVLDLYSGTGALGIEALSRGAARATLVDTDTSAARRNLATLGLEDRAEVVRGDALRFLRDDSQAGPYDLVFCDPPYRLASRIEQDLATLIPPRLGPSARVIVESAAREPIRLGLPVLTERRYGDTAVTVYGGNPS
ncbi:MAG: hypothetical protein QOG26_964 [Solirubrobacterales bacterium]|nr:hypothetical protein [Solirubrobacterales bacterium]